MASPTPKRPPTTSQYPPRPPAGPPEIVNPFWLLKAVAVIIVLALVCAYLTLCLLVYQGQWQLVLHPDTNSHLTTDLPIQPIRFGASETGQPSLTGLWLPAASLASTSLASNSPASTSPTVLYLPDGSGRLADDLPTLNQLHQLPVNIFAFDYRGFGSSDPTPHPTQARMTQDAASALDYLINTRHIDPHTIVPYGAGLGASLATALAAQHPELPALILESPVPNAYNLARSDPRAHFVPLSLLFHERFEITGPLNTLRTPKLLLTNGPSHTFAPSDPRLLDSLFHSAATPSYTAHLLPWSPQDPPAVAYRESISRFLTEYLSPHPAQGLTP